jgi:hypothetical protein
MKLILEIRVLPGMDVQQFVIPLDLTGAATLRIAPSQNGGRLISILDEGNQKREWFAVDIVSVRFDS